MTSIFDEEYTKWLDRFVEEKGLDPDHVFEIESDGTFGTNFIPLDALIETIKGAPRHEREEIRTMIVRIDFTNGDVMPFFEHLCGAIAI